MASRLELHEKLVSILGSENVYYQPPSNIQMQYPCIIYRYSDTDKKYADNGSYIIVHRYSVQLLTYDPDNTTKDKLIALPLCAFDRHYAKDGLNHYNYQLYF